MHYKIKPKVVLDSVVLVSAILTKGLAAELIDLCRERTCLYTSEDILEEVRRVLLEKDRIRSFYKYSDEEVDIFIDRFRRRSDVLDVLPNLRVIERDPKDDKVIACAVAAHADYIVSRDLDLLDLEEYGGIKIISPENFIHYLRGIH
jgi:putative PIN family toxin of toxin-antitoxin system